MSTREYFEGLHRGARIHGYGPKVLATSFEFVNDYPMPKIHGRLRQPLPPSLPLGSAPLQRKRKSHQDPLSEELATSIENFIQGRKIDREIEEINDRTRKILERLRIKDR
jgi:hypothetical protein